MHNTILIFGILIFLSFDFGSTVLTGHDNKDITTEQSFNCRWLGGSDSTLFCSCISGDEEYYIKENSIPSYDVYAINITHCGKIRFGAKSIFNMRNLRMVHLSNIASITFDEGSFEWLGYIKNDKYISEWDSSIPSLKITIENSTIEQISSHAIRGRINKILFRDVRIENIASFGFTSLEQTLEMIFERVVFKNILPQSFKKFTTQNLIIRNSTFGTIPSRAFYDISIKQEFILDQVQIDTLKPSGFIVQNPRRFEVRHSNINNLNGEGFKVTTRGDVAIKNNRFNNTGTGAFNGITINKEEVQSLQKITFENNIFNNLNKDSLLTDDTSFVPKFNTLQLHEECDCANLERYFRNNENTDEVRCLFKESEWISVNDFKKYNCSVFDTQQGTAIIITCVTLVLVILIVSGLVIYFKKIYKCGSYGEQQSDKSGKLSMIVPDGRTYIETELHVIVERADLLTTDL